MRHSSKNRRFVVEWAFLRLKSLEFDYNRRALALEIITGSLSLFYCSAAASPLAFFILHCEKRRELLHRKYGRATRARLVEKESRLRTPPNREIRSEVGDEWILTTTELGDRPRITSRWTPSGICQEKQNPFFDSGKFLVLVVLKSET